MKTIIQLQNNKLLVKGSLTHDTVMDALAQINELLPLSQTIMVDLEEVESCDSASLAFLIAVLQQSKKNHTQVTFCNLPKQMLDISKVSGLDTILFPV